MTDILPAARYDHKVHPLRSRRSRSSNLFPVHSTAHYQRIMERKVLLRVKQALRAHSPPLQGYDYIT
jgi:hypothetical protein